MREVVDRRRQPRRSGWRARLRGRRCEQQQRERQARRPTRRRLVPSVNVLPNPFRGVDVAAEQRRRLGDGPGGDLKPNTSCTSDAGTPIVRSANSASARRSRLVRRVGQPAVEPRDVAEERAERMRGRGDQVDRPRAIAASFEKALAQVDQVALRLQLAGPPQVRLGDRGAGERVIADDGDVARDDLAVLSGEDVEERSEFVRATASAARRGRSGASGGLTARRRSGPGKVTSSTSASVCNS